MLTTSFKSWKMTIIKPEGGGVNHQYLELGKYSANNSKRMIFDSFWKGTSIPDLLRRLQEKSLRTFWRAFVAFLEIDDSFKFDFSEKSNASALPCNVGLNRFLVNLRDHDHCKKIDAEAFAAKTGWSIIFRSEYAETSGS